MKSPIGYIYIMGTLRKTRQVWKSEHTLEGAGVRLRRAFGYRQLPKLDPFLLLDDFHSNNPADYIKGFPWHPHRGIETITYVLNGNVEHGDSLGNSGLISSGDVQWMTAGSGIIHQEMPKGDKSGLLWGFQLWANLPASHKMMAPRYQDVKSDVIPEVMLDEGIRIRVISGTFREVRGPVQNVMINPEFLDVTIPPRTALLHTVGRGRSVFAYVVEGEGSFDRERELAGTDGGGSSPDPASGSFLGAETLVTYGDGEDIRIAAGDGTVRFLLVSGDPLKEPIAWRGPIVMNTREELSVAFEEYARGTFIRNSRRDIHETS